MKRDAFTLLESVIVLVIAVLIVMIISPSMNKSRQIAMERQFWTKLHSCWDLEVNKARRHHQRMIIYADGHQMRVGQEILKMPQTLSTHDFAVLNVHKDGFVAPQTRVLYSSIDHSRYVLKIQMGWGGYRVEKIAGW